MIKSTKVNWIDDTGKKQITYLMYYLGVNNLVVTATGKTKKQCEKKWKSEINRLMKLGKVKESSAFL